MAASLRSQFREAHRAFAAASNSAIACAAARYAVGVVCEDVIVNGVLDGCVPLALSTWRARTGLSELPPIVSADHRKAWAARVHIDVCALRAYASAVYLSTDAFLARQADDAPLTGRVLEALLLRLRHNVGSTS